MSRREVAAASQIESAVGVEGRLNELARAGGPLRRVLVALAARLVERRAFEPLGYARLGDYTRERLGVSARQVRELAQVGAKLPSLPRLEAALVEGRLPWSKVRLIARVASARDEAWLIERARNASVRTLERELRVVARGALEADPGDEEGGSREPTDSVSLRVPASVAFKWARTCRDAQRVAGETASRATVLEWVTAEVLAGLPAGLVDSGSTGSTGSSEATGSSGSDRPGSPPASVPVVARGSPLEVERGEAAVGAGTLDAIEPLPEDDDAPRPKPAELPGFVRGLVEDLPTLDPFELDARLRRAVRLEQRRDCEVAPLLRAATAPCFEWRGRYPSLAAYAREQLGMSPRKARALLRIERVGDLCPELRAAFRDGQLSWAQAQQVARLAVGGEADNAHLASWVAWAQTVSMRKLEETVSRAALLDDRSHPEAIAAALDPEPEPSEERQTCAHPTDPLEDFRVTLTAPRDVIGLFSATLCTVRLELERESGRLPTPAEGFEAMLDRAIQAWALEDPWLRRRARRENAIFERDGWRCTVPGCTSRRNLQRHHIVFRSAGGSDEPENQTTLCVFHHLRGVHDGRVRVTGRAPDALRFELGTRADRAPLVRYRSDDRIAEED